MTLTIDLPPQLEQELEDAAAQEGVAVTDHATLLLYLGVALRNESKETAFQHAVKRFLAQHALNADQVATVFEELLQHCLHIQSEDTSASDGQAAPHLRAADPAYESLRAWRNRSVHQPLTGQASEAALRGMPSQVAGRPPTTPSEGDARRRPTALGKYAHVPGSSDDFAREKQDEIAREDRHLR